MPIEDKRRRLDIEDFPGTYTGREQSQIQKGVLPFSLQKRHQGNHHKSNTHPKSYNTQQNIRQITAHRFQRYSIPGTNQKLCCPVLYFLIDRCNHDLHLFAHHILTQRQHYPVTTHILINKSGIFGCQTVHQLIFNVYLRILMNKVKRQAIVTLFFLNIFQNIFPAQSRRSAVILYLCTGYILYSPGFYGWIFLRNGTSLVYSQINEQDDHTDKYTCINPGKQLAVPVFLLYSRHSFPLLLTISACLL